ncbi:MAG: hypothetical protein ACLGHE_03985 [Gammaproteobacteria bacterium]
MINIHRIDEVESLIREGRHCKARHVLRDLLVEIKTCQPADRQQAEKNGIVAGLLSDTLDMLLLFYHESQISLSALRAARLLLQVQPSSRSSTMGQWRRIKY